MKFKYVIVGAGLAGSVFAERIANKLGEDVLIVDKRNHIGGNVYDEYDEYGIMIHKYGPHIFHTKVREVWEYLSGFTQWKLYQHKVLAYVDGMKVPMPINLDTINMLMGTNYTSENLNDFFESVREKIDEPKNAKESVTSKVGKDLYEKFFKNYTIKQWNTDPENLNASITARIPIRTNRDPRYFNDKYQGMPLKGYTNMVSNILNSPKIHLLLNTDFFQIRDMLDYDYLIYTAPLDRLYDYKFGKLPYRSLKFEFETIETEFFQEVGTVNYPNDYDFTRITEFKHLTGQKSDKTTIMKEFPASEGEPYYPILNETNLSIAEKYIEQAKKDSVILSGRLATYSYLNMDLVVKQSLELFDKYFCN
jgi:UDP-galactopyranose mutase